MKNSLLRLIFTILLCGLLSLAGAANAQGTYTDRFSGSVIATIGKQPVAAATTANINLSGSQTIDGVTVSDHSSDSTGKQPDRVLVKNQTDTTQNGIYVVNNSGTWFLAQDFSGSSGVVDGQLVYVVGGSTNAGFWTLTTADPICVGSSPTWAVGGCTASNITFVRTSISVTNLALNSADIFVGNAGNVAVGNPLSGDCTITNAGAITCTQTAGVNFTSAATTPPVNGDCMVATGGQWQAGSCTGPSGSGTVNIGTQNQLAYYPGSTNVVGGSSGIWTNSSGFLGIGTATPSVALTVQGAAKVSSTLTVTGHTTFESVTSTGATGTGNIMYSASPTTTGTLTVSAANFGGAVSGTSSIWSANVGIGTAIVSGSNRLEVNGAMSVGYPDAYGGGNALIVAGNVGIGTTIPANLLTVNGSESIGFAYASAPTGGLLVNGVVAIGTSSQVNGSLVGIWGTSSNTMTMQVAGTQTGFIIGNQSGTSTYNAELFYTNALNTNVGGISVSSSATTFNTSSDQRIKTNLVDVGTSNVNGNIIDQLAPKTYNFIEAYDPSQSAGEGFVAQSLYQIIPLAVTPGDSTDQSYTPSDGIYKMWQVDLSKIVPQIVADLQWIHSLFKNGANCSGAPTSGFVTVGGIVTHC